MHIKLNNFVDDVHALLKKTNISHQVHEPSIPQSTFKYLSDCVKSTYLSSEGKYLQKFETGLQKMTGSNKILLTNTGTSALQVALKIIGIEQKEVLVPSMTFVATTNAIIYNNGIPHFIDCEQDKLNIDHRLLEDYLKKITRMRNNKCINKITNKEIVGIIVVHSYGYPANFDAIKNICKKYHLQILEDAAAALGSYYKDKHLGTLGRMGVISFNGNKIITTGMGGALICKTTSDYKVAKHLISTAKTPPSHKYLHDTIGFNFRMANINAASGYSQLLNIREILRKKVELRKMYFDLISTYDFCDLLESTSNEKPNYWINNIVISAKNKSYKDQLVKKFHKKRIYVRELWTPQHRLKMFKNYPRMDLTNSIDIWKRTISLPSSINL